MTVLPAMKPVALVLARPGTRTAITHIGAVIISTWSGGSGANDNRIDATKNFDNMTPLMTGSCPAHVGITGDAPVEGRVVFVETQDGENPYDPTLAAGSMTRLIQSADNAIRPGDHGRWKPRSMRAFGGAEDGRRR